MSKHLVQTSVGLIGFGLRTTRTLGWYLSRRLARPV